MLDAQCTTYQAVLFLVACSRHMSMHSVMPFTTLRTSRTHTDSQSLTFIHTPTWRSARVHSAASDFCVAACATRTTQPSDSAAPRASGMRSSYTARMCGADRAADSGVARARYAASGSVTWWERSVIMGVLGCGRGLWQRRVCDGGMYLWCSVDCVTEACV